MFARIVTVLVVLASTAILPAQARAAGAKSNCLTATHGGKATLTSDPGVYACFVSGGARPVVRIDLHNPHPFWTKIAIDYNSSLDGPLVVAKDNWVAKAGYLPPDSDAMYTVTFKRDTTSYLQFFANAGASEDGRPSAGLLSVIDQSLTALGFSLAGMKDPKLLGQVIAVIGRARALHGLSKAIKKHDAPKVISDVKSFLGTRASVNLLYTIIKKVAKKSGKKMLTKAAIGKVFTIWEIGKEVLYIGQLGAALVSGSYAGNIYVKSVVPVPRPKPMPTPGPRGFPTAEAALGARLGAAYIGQCPSRPAAKGTLCSMRFDQASHPPVYVYSVGAADNLYLYANLAQYYYLGQYRDGTWAVLGVSKCQFSPIAGYDLAECVASSMPSFQP